jgi:hypothetical protein
MEQALPQQLTMTTDDDVASVPAYRDLLEKLLAFAATIKRKQAIEPPLPTAELGERIRTIYENESLPAKENKQAHYAAIETAFRDKFYGLIVRPSRSPTALEDADDLRLLPPSMTQSSLKFGISWIFCQSFRITVIASLWIETHQL